MTVTTKYDPSTGIITKEASAAKAAKAKKFTDAKGQLFISKGDNTYNVAGAKMK